MNYQEILEELKKQFSSVKSFAYSSFYKISPLPVIGAAEEVERKGGEGQGEEWYSVKYFADHDVYVRIDGFYSSDNGVDFWDDWNSCGEVRPQQKTITVYEPLKA